MIKENEGKAGKGPFGVLGGLAGMAGMLGMAGYAMASSYASRAKEKSREEYESEIEKWEKQAGILRFALLDLSVCVSEKCREQARLEEEARLAKLAADRTEKEYEARITELEKELAVAKRSVAEAQARVSESALPGSQP